MLLSIMQNSNVYGFTYNSKKKGIVTEQDFNPVLDVLRKSGNVVEYQCEDLNKKGMQCKLHIHGILEFNRRNPYLKKLCVTGFQMKWELIYDYDGWNRYCCKQTKIDNTTYMF